MPMDRDNRELMQLVAEHIEAGVRNREVLRIFSEILRAEGVDELADEVEDLVADDRMDERAEWCLAALVRVGQAELQRLGELRRQMENEQ